MKEITSTKNEQVKILLSMNEKTNVERTSEMLVESPKVVFDLMKKGSIVRLYVTKVAYDKYDGLKTFGDIVLISDAVAEKLSDTKTTTGVFGVTKISKCTNHFGDRVLVLDGLQDPSNIGAIIRTAKATDFNDILFIGGVYPYSNKVVRSSMSHIFGVNVHFGGYSDLEALKSTHKVITADLDGQNIFERNKNYEKFALVIGNEGNGISEEAKALCDITYTIPMNKEVESLNASVSAGILMYNLINNK